MVDDYGYLNARVRAWKSKLFGRGMYEELLTKPDLFTIGLVLQKTPYGPDLEEVTGHPLTGAEGFDRGIRRNLSRTLQQLYAMTGEKPRELTAIVVSRWDIHNLKAILRGKHGRASAEEILGSLVPAGRLGEPLLKELANALDVEGVISLLATWGIGLAGPLQGALEAFRRTMEPGVLEMALNHHYYRGTVTTLSCDDDENSAKVVKNLRREIDLINVRTALSLLGEAVPQGREPEYFLPGGIEITLPRFTILARAQEMEPFLSGLRGTRIGAGLEAKATQFAITDPLVAEGLIDQLQMEEGAAWFLRDPLGIGIIIGYLWKKVAEVANLRWIVQGKGIGMPVEEIRRELIIV